MNGRTQVTQVPGDRNDVAGDLSSLPAEPEPSLPGAGPPTAPWSPEAPVTGPGEASQDDLAILAANLQLILQQEARRHGIDV